MEDALSYRVYMSPESNVESFSEYIEVQDTSYVDLESYSMDRKFYRVYSLLRDFRQFEAMVQRSTITEASLGAADIRWNVRRNRLGR